jgi:hypothetical protein
LPETFVDDDSRGMFHNAQEFELLYSDVVRRPIGAPTARQPRLPDSRAARNLRFCAADSSMTSTSRQKAGSVPAFTPILPGI